MRPPEITYSFSVPKDVSGPPIELMSRRQSVSQTTQNFVLSFVGIPIDRILVLTNANIVVTPGAAEQLLHASVQAFTGAGQVFNIASLTPDGTDGQRESLNWSGEVWLQGRGQDEILLQTQFNYDATGATNNVSTFDFAGFVIPRGNVAQF